MARAQYKTIATDIPDSAEVSADSIGQQAFGSFAAGPIPPNIATPRHEGTTDRE